MKQVWQSQPPAARKLSGQLLLQQVQRNQRSFNAMILLRDVREVGVGILMVPVWIFLGVHWHLPWTWYLAVPGIVFVAGFMVVDRWRRKPATSSADEPLVATTTRSLAEVNHQIWLLRNIFWWYILPLLAPAVLFLIHVAWKTRNQGWNAVIVLVFTAAVFAIVNVFVYWLNQRAVRKELEPRRQELEVLLASLRDEATSTNS